MDPALQLGGAASTPSAPSAVELTLLLDCCVPHPDIHKPDAGDAPLPGIMKIGPAVCRGRKRGDKGTKLIGAASTSALLHPIARSL